MTVPIQIRIDEKQLEEVKKTARLKSVAENKDISWRDLLREAIASKYPIKKSK